MKKVPTVQLWQYGTAPDTHHYRLEIDGTLKGPVNGGLFDLVAKKGETPITFAEIRAASRLTPLADIEADKGRGGVLAQLYGSGLIKGYSKSTNENGELYYWPSLSDAGKIAVTQHAAGEVRKSAPARRPDGPALR